MANYTRRASYAMVGAVALIGGFLFSLYEPEATLESKPMGVPVTTAATVIPNPRPVEAFHLQDHQGNPFSTRSLNGNWTILVFGYTYCPDICPSALTMLSQVDSRLKAEQGTDPYRIVFVTIDPERDTRERLAQYVSYFNSDFVGVRGDESELRKLTSQLGVIYTKVAAERGQDDYLMDHSASIVLIDPQGRFRAVFSAPHDAAAIAADFMRISS